MSLFAKIKRWYLGGPLPLREETENGGLICRSPDTFEPSASARIAQFLVKSSPAILAALFAAAVALFIHFDAKSAEHGGYRPSNREETKSVKPVVVVPVAHDSPPTRRSTGPSP